MTIKSDVRFDRVIPREHDLSGADIRVSGRVRAIILAYSTFFAHASAHFLGDLHGGRNARASRSTQNRYA